MRKATLGLVVAAWIGITFFAALAPPTAADHIPCNPYPLDRCGAFQREEVQWCYYVVPPPPAPNPTLVDATERHVLTVGPTTPGVVSQDGAQPGTLYVRYAPTEALVADPWEAPMPTGSAYLETNEWPGLQTAEARCSTFIWFAECEPPQWMWFTYAPLPPDKLIA